MRSGVSLSAMRMACIPSAAMRTSWPFLCSRRDSMSRFMSLSSTSRILAIAKGAALRAAPSGHRLSHTRPRLNAREREAPHEGAELSCPGGNQRREVCAALGEPEAEVVFGAKTRWTYPGVSVVFEKGEVVDVKF